MLRPYVVRQGDHLTKLAERFGFDVDTVWNDVKNQPLREQGRTPSLLHPGDMLFIPEPKRNFLKVNPGTVVTSHTRET